ncbi:unnamed protein product [Lactuca saligna]|uniref:Uncharacterized protein n=1 Tax=Lactuca saligna TaxID=75948 RepID=A0AA35ZUI1_LACSI|nr:unnamed protein product [Lactuca saligna]
MVSRKKGYLNENVDKVDCMVNFHDHPIEIEDDEVSEGKKFRSDEVNNENNESPIEINSSNSMKKTIDISSSNSWKKKKPRNNVYHITRSKKLVNRSDRKFSKTIVSEHGLYIDNVGVDFSIDSDFEDGTSSSVKRVDKIGDKKVKKKMELNCAKIKSLYSLVSLHSIYGVVNSMNHNKKECVRSLGFGSLIDMKTQSIPAKLCYFVLDSFDPLEMVIKNEVSNILVTREDVNRVLGLPIGVD